MPRKHNIDPNAKRKVADTSSVDFTDESVLERIYEWAYNGFFDAEIAEKLNIDRYTFAKRKERDKKLRQLLEDARTHAQEDGADMPSVAKFAEVWQRCNGKRSQLLKEFRIGWTKFQSWCAQEPRFIDIMAERDIEFLEQIDIAGRILALGGVKGKDQFKGWSRYPDSWMMRFYMNTIGKRYGYGENPVLPEDTGEDIPRDADNGIDIESWIKQEMLQKKEAASTSEETDKSDNTEDD